MMRDSSENLIPTESMSTHSCACEHVLLCVHVHASAIWGHLFMHGYRQTSAWMSLSVCPCLLTLPGLDLAEETQTGFMCKHDWVLPCPWGNRKLPTSVKENDYDLNYLNYYYVCYLCQSLVIPCGPAFRNILFFSIKAVLLRWSVQPRTKAYKTVMCQGYTFHLCNSLRVPSPPRSQVSTLDAFYVSTNLSLNSYCYMPMACMCTHICTRVWLS